MHKVVVLNLTGLTDLSGLVTIIPFIPVFPLYDLSNDKRGTLMNTESLAIDTLTVSPVVQRSPFLEQPMQLIKIPLPSPPILPGFEFVIEIDGKTVWSGLDLPGQYAHFCQQYPEQELVIGWRSSPVVWI